jgi:cytidylate kinase
MLNELLGIHPPMLELIHKMTNTILNLAETGNVILIGRGSNVITSHLKNVYHIRLVAPLDVRINKLLKNKDITKDWARKELLREEQNRKDFLFKTFRKDIDDPILYHTIINVSLFSIDELAGNIIEIIKCKHPTKQSQWSKRKILSKGTIN